MSLYQLHLIEIPGPYASKGLVPLFSSLCVLSVMHLRMPLVLSCTLNVHKGIGVTFVMGESKWLPKGATIISRMELCATVNAIQSAITNVPEIVKKKSDKIIFYSDNKVVLGYIYNEERRFARYVGNRVYVIRKLSKPTDWSFIVTSVNPGRLCYSSSNATLTHLYFLAQSTCLSLCQRGTHRPGI